MSTTEKSNLEAVVEALVKKEPIDPKLAERVHRESTRLRKRFDTEVSLEALRSLRDDE
jgi:hypothetical protein